MKSLGLRMDTYGTENLVRQNWRGCPTVFPGLPDGHYVVGGLGIGIEDFEDLFILETLDDMQQLYEACQSGGGTNINWYIGQGKIGSSA